MREKVTDLGTKIWSEIDHHKKGTVFLINLIFIILACCIGQPYNETNDDTGMSAIASGAYGGDREYLVFQNVIFGKFLHLFYIINGELNWYSIVQFLITILSFCVIGYVLMEKIGGFRGFLIYIFLMKLLYQEFYLIYQFTRVSMLCCLAGYLLLFFAFLKDRTRWEKLLGIVLILTGALIRTASFKEITGFAFFVGVCSILLNKKFYPVKDNRKLWIEGIITACIVAMASVGMMQYNKHIAQNEEWKEYQEYNHMRAVIQDYGWPDYWLDYETYQKEYEEMGISENDYHMYVKGNLSDTDVLDMETVKKLYEFKNEKMREYRPGIVEYIRFTLSDTVVSQFFFINLIILMLYFLLYKRSCYDYLMLTNIGIYILMYAYMYHCNRVVDRVAIPTNTALIIISLFCYDLENRKEVDLESKKILAWVGIFLLILPGTSRHYMELKADRRDGVELYEELENKERLFVAGHDVFRWNYYFFNAYKNIPKDFYLNQMNMGGWLARTPIQEQIKKKNGVDNIFEALLEKDNIYYYTKNSEGVVAAYLEEHYSDGNVGYSICKDIDLCKFVKYTENIDTTDLKYAGEASGLKCNQDSEGNYIEISLDIQVEEEKLIGNESEFYLKLTDKNTGEETTYYFYDDLETCILEENNKIMFQIPYRQNLKNVKILTETYDVKGILQQGEKQYIFSVIVI